MTFKLLSERLIEAAEHDKETTKFYIENGFCENWNEESKIFSDNGLKRYSTETRWDQYQHGNITREKAVEFAVKRMVKNKDADLIKKLDKLLKVAEAPELTNASIYVEYRKSRTWGYCPSVEMYSNTGNSAGYASGCGYDKESAAVAEALNKNNSFLKVLYTLKENALEAGSSDHSKTACTGVDNRNIIGYGSGYSVLPYFEGGVGVNCYWDILKKAGFEISCHYTRSSNTYVVFKK